jgi:hypothetical protein
MAHRRFAATGSATVLEAGEIHKKSVRGLSRSYHEAVDIGPSFQACTGTVIA